jgi:hypothetical protein
MFRFQGFIGDRVFRVEGLGFKMCGSESRI